MFLLIFIPLSLLGSICKTTNAESEVPPTPDFTETPDVTGTPEVTRPDLPETPEVNGTTVVIPTKTAPTTTEVNGTTGGWSI